MRFGTGCGLSSMENARAARQTSGLYEAEAESNPTQNTTIYKLRDHLAFPRAALA
jgi:hypothetical protein